MSTTNLPQGPFHVMRYEREVKLVHGDLRQAADALAHEIKLAGSSFGWYVEDCDGQCHDLSIMRELLSR